MPKLTRDVFLSGLADLWTLAQNNFHRDTQLHSMLVAVDAMGRQKFFMQAPAGEPSVVAAGAIPVSGPWQDHVDLIGAEFKAHRAVAGIMLGEAWTASGETAIETLRMDIAVHEHPMRDEIIMVLGLWPAEFVMAGYRATIVRDERGENKGLVDLDTFTGESAAVLITWMADILPAPHGARAWP